MYSIFIYSEFFKSRLNFCEERGNHLERFRDCERLSCVFLDVLVLDDDDSGDEDEAHEDCEEDFSDVDVATVVASGNHFSGKVENCQCEDD